MHIITDEEYKAYIASIALRAYLSGATMQKVDLEEALGRAIAAHNKRLNSLKRVHGT